MLFHTFQFLLFFPIVVLVTFAIPVRARNLWLLIASYFFYMCWHAGYAVLLATSTAVTYAGGRLIEQTRNGKIKKAFLATSLVINLGILFYFKYFNFAIGLMNLLFSKIGISIHVPLFDILLPVGISFYIFQALGYLIDVYRGDVRAEKNLLRYALFVSFFPQLVAGPIERSKNLLGQMAFAKTFEYDRIRSGLLTMLWGYFLKVVIADRCAVLVDTVYAAYDSYMGYQIITANIAFAIQIYCDFMGYSTIAKGAAQVLGYELMDNFHQPYFAVSIKDFWHRWHISLSSWLRDYVYFSLGGGINGKIKKYRNIMVTFLISGLWHGADVTFVLWGLMHGIYQVVEEALSEPMGKLGAILKVRINTASWVWPRRLITFVFVDIAWVFFRASDVVEAVGVLRASVHFGNIGDILSQGGIYDLGLSTLHMNILALSMAVLFVVGILCERGMKVLEWISSQTILFRYALYWGAIILIILSMNITGKEFIYFQF